MVASGNFGCALATKLAKKPLKKYDVHKRKILKQTYVVSVLKMEAANRTQPMKWRQQINNSILFPSAI